MTRDTPSLHLTHLAVRRACEAVRGLPQKDPGVRETVTRLDEIAVEIAEELADAELELELRV